MEIDETSAKELRDWLMAHETDIAIGLEDYDDLRYVFEAVIGRVAKDRRELHLPQPREP